MHLRVTNKSSELPNFASAHPHSGEKLKLTNLIGPRVKGKGVRGADSKAIVFLDNNKTARECLY
jgi:hypothetical protein